MQWPYVLLLAVATCVLAGNTRPDISETFQASINIIEKTRDASSSGKGIWAVYQQGQVSVEHYTFENDTFDAYKLNRYDLGKLYRIFGANQTECQSFPVADEMPDTWDWIQYTSFIGNDTFNGAVVNIWQSTIGYSTRKLAVLASDPTTPVWLSKLGTEKDTLMVFTTYSDAIPPMSVFAVAAACKKPINKTPTRLLQCMDSNTILSNAQVWVDAHVPYDQESTYMSYRTDCSGYVSYTWQAGAPGLDTADFYQQAFPISKSQLQPGDCMLNAGDHVCLFGGWTDDNQTYFTAYEETQPCSDDPNWCGTLKHNCKYPYYYDGPDFLPYRFNGFCGSSSGSSTAASTYGAGMDNFFNKRGGDGRVPGEETAKKFDF